MDRYQTRKKNRLQNFDYSTESSYFLTICTYNKENLFWIKNYHKKHAESYNGYLNSLGDTVRLHIEKINEIYTNTATVDKYVIMPNHIHLLITIYQNDVSKKASIPQIIKQLKRNISISSTINPIWQKGYFDHIIRNEKDYNEIWDYIDANPRKITGNIFLK